MSSPHFNVLFLCSGNSARSIMAEALMNAKGPPAFRGYSAGTHPAGRVHPVALKQIEKAAIPTEGLRSKSWEEFARPDAPEMHFIFTVCDKAAAEVCPVWPGKPVSGSWDVPDPEAVTGTEEEIDRAFLDASMVLARRIDLLLCLPLATLEEDTIQHELAQVGPG